MSGTADHRWRPGRGSAVAAVCVLSVFGLTAAGVLGPAQAAPVPAAQAPCPPPVDPQPVTAATTSYARIDGIPGDATASQVAGQVALTSVRTGLLAGGSGLCGAGQGRPAVDPVVLEKRIDRASVPLLARAAQGQLIPAVRITVWTTGSAPRQLLSYELANVAVASVRQLQRGDSLTEEVALTFARITWTFTTQRPDGGPGAVISSCFDVARNALC